MKKKLISLSVALLMIMQFAFPALAEAFYECASLKSVEMPKVQTIDDRAFSGCSGT